MRTISEPQFSKHALNQMKRRGISIDMAVNIIDSPDQVNNQGDEILVFSKLIYEGTKCYLYRIFVNELSDPALIVTTYKASKIKKYGNSI